MTLYEVFKNHHNTSFDALIDKQYCLDGEDLNNTKPLRFRGAWKKEALEAR